MTMHEARLSLVQQLGSLYDAREAGNIAEWVLEHLTGLRKIDRIMYRDRPLTEEQAHLLANYTAQLVQHRPVQYVLQEAWFAGMRFYVDENVLIPRPETEELVAWVEDEAGGRRSEAGGRRSEAGGRRSEVGSSGSLRILDVGTGSGCIPIALKKKLPTAEVYACDVSEGALQVARKNAAALDAPVTFYSLDILNEAAWADLPAVDIIVSNPPYIPLRDKDTMRENVLQYEPHLALFVENNDPLLFYDAIARLAQERLLPGGRLFVEIHEELGNAVASLFTQSGLQEVVVKHDLQEKDRMVKAEVGSQKSEVRGC